MNIVNHIEENSRLLENKVALTFPHKNDYQKLSFKELSQAINFYCFYFSESGIKANDKVLLFIKPSLKFAPIVFALFKMGAIPVLIDPGMGKNNLLKSVAQVKPDHLIAEPIVLFIKHFFQDTFKSIRLSFSVGFPFIGNKIPDFSTNFNLIYPVYSKAPQDLCAILFTSGGTGVPKGVEYTHEIYDNQISMLKSMFNLKDSDVDCPAFPLFSLFTLAMGMTSCIPDMNPSKPAKANPKKLYKNITDHQCTFIAGSPAIWENLAHYCHQHQLTLPSVKYLVMFGAPVSLKIHESFVALLTNGTTYTPYGATESLPIACISGKEILSSFKAKMLQGQGTCLGKVVSGVEVRIYEDSLEAEPFFNPAKVCAPMVVGEILIRSKIATASYYQMDEETYKAKVYTDDGFYHRIGDLGYLDYDQNLWFCGRKTHKVMSPKGTYYPIPVEAIFNQHPMIKRTALVGLGQSPQCEPAIVVERIDHFMTLNKKAHQEFMSELKVIASHNHLTKNINKFFLYDYFPVDIRHNIKIDRLKLKHWADKMMERE